MANATERSIEFTFNAVLGTTAPTPEALAATLATAINAATGTQLKTARINGRPIAPTTPYAPTGVRPGDITP